MPSIRTALFLTCSADLLYPSAGRAAVRVLENLGAEVFFPAAQTCCGQAWFNTGRWKEGERLAHHFLREFERFDAVVGLSASCVDTVRHRYPVLFRDRPRLAERFEALGCKTFEFCEFLHRKMDLETAPPLPHPRLVTYHSSCRTLRGIELRGVAETYLRQMAGEAFVPLREGETCCGFGGSFSVKLPEVSGRLLEEKLRDVEATGAELVTSLDLSCLTHLSGGAARLGLGGLRFAHLVEVLAEAFGEGA